MYRAFFSCDMVNLTILAVASDSGVPVVAALLQCSNSQHTSVIRLPFSDSLAHTFVRSQRQAPVNNFLRLNLNCKFGYVTRAYACTPSARPWTVDQLKISTKSRRWVFAGSYPLFLLSSLCTDYFPYRSS